MTSDSDFCNKSFEDLLVEDERERFRSSLGHRASGGLHQRRLWLTNHDEDGNGVGCCLFQTEKWGPPVLPLSRNEDQRIVVFGGLPNLGQPHLEFANENTIRFQKTRATEQCPKSMMFDADGGFTNLSNIPKL